MKSHWIATLTTGFATIASTLTFASSGVAKGEYVPQLYCSATSTTRGGGPVDTLTFLDPIPLEQESSSGNDHVYYGNTDGKTRIGTIHNPVLGDYELVAYATVEKDPHPSTLGQSWFERIQIRAIGKSRNRLEAKTERFTAPYTFDPRRSYGASTHVDLEIASEEYNSYDLIRFKCWIY